MAHTDNQSVPWAAPSTTKTGTRSWVRMEPLGHGVRAEIHLDDDDDLAKVIAKARELITTMRKG